MRVSKQSLFSADVVVATLAPVAALFARFDFDPALAKIANIAPYTVITLPVIVVCFLAAGLHRLPWRHFSLADAGRIAAATTVAIAVACVLAFLLGVIDRVPRSLPPLQFAITVLAMAAIRYLARLRIQRRQRMTGTSVPAWTDKRRFLLVGLNAAAEGYLQLIAALAPNAAAVEGILDERPAAHGQKLRNIEVMGRPQDIEHVLAGLKVHCIDVTRVVLAVPFASLSADAQAALRAAESSGAVELDAFVDRLGFDRDNRLALERHKQGEGSMLAAVEAQARTLAIRPLAPDYLKAKRRIDGLVAGTLLVVISPLLAVACLLVLVDLGFPLMFWQQRPGLHGRPFRLFKLRTMGPGHDEQGRPIADLDRLSPIGRFLRKTRLDELPQLFNILIGEMSFVGPRPLMAIHLPEHGEVRYLVRPGLTGWAQINGGVRLSEADKIALDIWYLRRASHRLDLRIVWQTLYTVVAGDRVDGAALAEARREASSSVDAPPASTPRPTPSQSRGAWRPIRETDVNPAE